MRTTDDTYSSFTSAMIKLEPTLRLPMYRSSYSARFHPYPRGGPRRSEIVFTDRLAHAEGPSSNPGPGGPAQPRIDPVRRCTAVPDDADVSSFEMDLPVVGVEYEEEELAAPGISTGLSQSKLALLLSDLLGALRRAFLEPTMTMRTLGGFKVGITLFK